MCEYRVNTANKYIHVHLCTFIYFYTYVWILRISRVCKSVPWQLNTYCDSVSGCCDWLWLGAFWCVKVFVFFVHVQIPRLGKPQEHECVLIWNRSTNPHTSPHCKYPHTMFALSFESRFLIENCEWVSQVCGRSRWQTLNIPFALTPIGELHQSPHSPVPGGPVNMSQSPVSRNWNIETYDISSSTFFWKPQFSSEECESKYQ